MIPILILAGGGSTRMRGRDKLLEPVGGVPLLRRLAEQALATGQPVFVALPAPDHPRQAVLAGLELTVLIIPEAAEGMSGTMRGAVRQLPDCAAFMMVLGDLVAIGTAEMLAILAARDDNPAHLIWRGATTNGRPGHPIIFDSTLRPAFDALTGDGGGETLVNPLKDQTHLTQFADDRARLDLDTPEDWAKWRRGAT